VVFTLISGRWAWGWAVRLVFICSLVGGGWWLLVIMLYIYSHAACYSVWLKSGGGGYRDNNMFYVRVLGCKGRRSVGRVFGSAV